MTSLLASKFLEILNMGVASGAAHAHEDHALEVNHEGQEEKGRQVRLLTPEAAVRLGIDSRRLPADYDGGVWS